MSETMRLSVTHDDGQVWSAELRQEAIKLDDLTWEWLKGAFKAIGFADSHVNEFFNDSNVGQSDER